MGVVHKFRGGTGPYRWDGVQVHEYNAGVGKGSTRQVLIGEAEGAPNFVIRYFELPPGNASEYHTHEHEHGVVVLRGKGRVRIGEQQVDLSFGDAVYVPSNEIHQFTNIGDEPFGFTCTIKAK